MADGSGMVKLCVITYIRPAKQLPVLAVLGIGHIGIHLGYRKEL